MRKDKDLQNSSVRSKRAPQGKLRERIVISLRASEPRVHGGGRTQPCGTSSPTQGDCLKAAFNLSPPEAVAQYLTSSTLWVCMWTLLFFYPSFPFSFCISSPSPSPSLFLSSLLISLPYLPSSFPFIVPLCLSLFLPFPPSSLSLHPSSAVICLFFSSTPSPPSHFTFPLPPFSSSSFSPCCLSPNLLFSSSSPSLYLHHFSSPPFSSHFPPSHPSSTLPVSIHIYLFFLILPPSSSSPPPPPSCRYRPHRGVLRLPLRRLRADHGATASPAEHRHHAAHRQDDRGGKNTLMPQSALLFISSKVVSCCTLIHLSEKWL